MRKITTVGEKTFYNTRIALNTSADIEEFVNICSKIPEEVMIRGKDEHDCDWYLSAKSLLCSLFMNARLQKYREHTAHEVNWDTIYVECERDIYSLISKFAI